MSTSFKKRILLVEDDPTHAFIIRKFIGQEFHLDHANNGQTAIELLMQQPYALILMDIDLGQNNLTGTEVLQKIRDKQEFRNIQAIATTAFDSPDARERLLSGGFNLHMAKPITKQVLLDGITALLGM